MSKPSHRLVLSKLLVLYLSFLLLLQQFGSQLKFQARADDVLVPQLEVDSLTTVLTNLGLKPAPRITNTFCQDPVSTYGITINCNTCVMDKTVCHFTGISITNIDLTTVIPEELGDLQHMKFLSLSGNKLHGPIPATLGNLHNLQTLDLSSNQLTGSIPDLGGLQDLRYLYLQFNLLEGSIPPTLGSLVNLLHLYLQFNRLSGSIPDELGKLVNLRSLSLSENQLNGPLPESLGNLRYLTHVWARSNFLSDPFPKTYGELTSLRFFEISGNYISDRLPVDIIKRWTNIEYLSLLGNNFKGNLTEEVFNLPNLQSLLISDLENATFELPSKITNTKYITLILRNCSINGSIPKYIGDQMTSLNHLDLSFNRLTGGLPEYMKSDLLYMSFSTNMLNGTIPAWILRPVPTRIDISFNNLAATESGTPRNPNLNLFACCNDSAATEPERRAPSEMMNTYCPGKEQKYHSLFINCGGGETTVNGITYEQDNDTASYFTSPNKNWGYSLSGVYLGLTPNSSDYMKNMTCGVSVAEAPLYDRARLSPVSLKYYAFCLREGNYTVTLKFAEIVYTEDTDYTSLRKRAFDIYIQDDKINVVHDFHIREQAGGPDKPITKNFTVAINKHNTLLTIHMYWNGKGSLGYEPAFNGPLISAISVTPDFKIHDEKLRPLHIALIVSGSTIIAVLILLAFAWMIWRSKYSREIKVGEEKNGEGTQDKLVTLKELINATGKFSDKKIIGSGNLGKVYRAQLQDRTKTTVAVKKLSSHFKENIQKLKKEIKLLYELSHVNLIKLFDYHIEKDLQLLVYEYMENRSLEDALTVDSNTRSLKFTWDTRYKICLGIARGLEYLHQHPKLNVAHMNIKAVNILLDGDLTPKISDFGFSHLFVEEDQFKVIKREVSQGYMAPEYFQGNLTMKADVYSFGVILLEIVSWKKNAIKTHHGTEVLVDMANKKHSQGNLEDMIDKTSGPCDTQQALTILKLALKCTNIAPSVRPSMSDAVSVLLKEKMIDDLSRPAAPNKQDSSGATSMDLISLPSTSSVYQIQR